MSTPDTHHDEEAERIAIRALVDAWAHCADRRKPVEQAVLFTEDGRVLVYAGDPDTREPIQSLTGHSAMAEAFKVLSGYDVTTHFTGQSTVRLDGNQATGETYCLAHHLWVERHADTHGHVDPLPRHIRPSEGHWLFAERVLVVDWTDKRPSIE